MADNNSITGSIVGKIRFNIDKKSWDNLELFQKKLTSIKRQMSSFDKTIKVQAVVQSINKVADATVKAEQKIDAVKEKVAKKERKRDTMNAHVQERNYRKAIEKQHAEALKLDKKFNQQRQKATSSSVSKPSGKLGTGMMASHVGLFHQNNRDYQEATKMNAKFDEMRIRQHQQALRMNEQFDKQRLRQKERAEREYDKRREKLLNARARANAARSRRKSGIMSANEAYKARVEAFITVKRNQLERTALMRGWSDSQKANAQSILTNNVNKFKAQFNGSKSGDIGNFRANVNGAVNQLSAMDAVTRRSAISLKSLRNELVQMTAAYTAFSVFQNVAQVGFEFESLRASARVFAKDDAGVADHMAFISEQAQRLGTDLQTATKEFTKFSIATQTTMSKSDQRNLFVSMSEYSRVLGLNKQDYERSFRAVQQIECCLPIQ